MSRDDQLAEVAAGLEALGERLGELATDRLRRAAEGSPEEAARAVAYEKRLNRARRAIEKAASLLEAP